ncbi:MAG: HEAT repeat domain-containing protein [candidate division WOR-3 bacterium]
MAGIVEISEKILKQIALALNTAKLYPPGHPLFEKMIENSLELTLEIPPNINTLSFYFFENTVIVEKEKLDISKFPAIQSLIKYLDRIRVKSISIDIDAQRKDWEAFYKMLSTPVKELKETEDIAVLLHELGAERIRVNDVEFGVISAKQKVELKFDIDSIIERIKKGEIISSEESIELFKETTGFAPERLNYISKDGVLEKIQEFKENIYKKYGFIEPEKLSIAIAEIFEKLSPDLRRDVLGDMIEIEELRNIAKEIIKNLNEEEIMEFLLSYKGNKEEIMEYLPENKKQKLQSLSILREKKEEPGAKIGIFYGEGILSKEMEERILKLYETIKIEKEENKIKEEVSKFLNELLGIKDYQDIKEKVPEFVNSLKMIASFLIEQYGADAFEEFSLLGSHILSLLTPDIKNNIYEHLSKTKETADMIRSILPSLPDEELITLFASRIKNFPEEVNEMVKVLPSEKIEILRKREIIEGGEGRPFVPSRKLIEIEKIARERHLIITGEKKFEAMKKEIEEGIRTAELENIIEPFLKDIKSEDNEKRKNSVNGIGSLLISFLKTGKTKLAKTLLNFLRENIEGEEDLEVFFTYLEYFEKGYVIAKEKNIVDIIEIFEVEFKKLLDLKEKRKFVINALGKTKTDFALRMLLTTLWEEESIEEIKEALIPLGEKASEYLLKLFPEVETLLIRKRIIELLILLPQTNIHSLKELIFDKRWAVQRDILYIVGEKRISEMIPYIEEILPVSEDIVRKEAIKALVKIKTKEAKEILIKSLEDKNEEIRKEVIKGLCADMDEKIVPRLRDYFKFYMEKNVEENTPLLIEIMKGLKKIKNKEILPFLFKIIEEKNILKKPKYPQELRREAIKYLVEFKEDKNVIEKLKSYKNDPDNEIRIFLKVFFSKYGE